MTCHKTMLAASIVAGLMFTGAAIAQDSPSAADGPQSQSSQQTQPTQTTEQTTPSRSSSAQKKSGAQPGPTNLKSVVVTGILQSQMNSIQLKQSAPQISDSISAENIGQLPDVTITDSLSRITGVQIDRSAGVGTSVNVRGLPEVETTLNGEAFLDADQIVSPQPNFATIPSQLFEGVDVFKSPTASMALSGISGTINLRTRRPWDLKPGWTLAGSAEGLYGGESKKLGPRADVLFSFNDPGKWGILFSASHLDTTRQNSSAGQNEFGGQIHGENAASATSGAGFLGAWGTAPIPPEIHMLGGGNVDVNGDGDHNDAFMRDDTFTAFDTRQKTKRTSFNASFQANLGAGLSLTVDGFFTHERQWNRIAGFEALPPTWQGATFVPLVSRDTGVKVSGPFNAGAWSTPQDFNTTQKYKMWLMEFDPFTRNLSTHSVARNYNVELHYDQGGPFTANLRFINASAAQTHYLGYIELTTNNGDTYPNPIVPGSGATQLPPGHFAYPGGVRVFNPNGLQSLSYFMTMDMRGGMNVQFGPKLAAFLSNPANYRLKTIAGEGDYDRNAGMNIARFDGHWNFFDGVKLDFGFRNSVRTTSNIGFDLKGPVYAGKGASDPNGCYVHYFAADVVLNAANNCTASNGMSYYRAGVLSGLGSKDWPTVMSSNFRKFTNMAEIKGLGFYVIDPKALDNFYQFANTVYPGQERDPNPGTTWAVLMHTRTAYLKMDFDGTLGRNVGISGNIGVRMVKTNLHITQNTTGTQPAYGLHATFGGPVYTDRSYTDWLPAANFKFGFTPKLDLRLAYSENMMPLNLAQWGGGLTLGYAINTNTGIFEVQSGSSSGNPQLKPWRSSNYGVSLEYYVNPTTMFSLAGFVIKVKSFIASGTTKNCNLPDLDGVVRDHCIIISTPVQGAGQTLHGLEFDYKQAFTSLPGFLSHTGTEVNFTYSPSNLGKQDLAGNNIPFPDNSKYSGNLVLWYQDRHFQFRVAGNYRSERAVSQNFSGITGLEQYQKSTLYVDASAIYKINQNIQVFLQGSNLTKEHETNYLTWKDQVINRQKFERTYRLGVRVNF